MEHVLFVCSQNRLRSPTAEQVFCDVPGFDVRSAGTNNAAECRLTAELVAWADRIFAMENVHKRKIQQRFREQLGDTRIVSLDIPDHFDYMAPELVVLLRAKLGWLFGGRGGDE